jgi:hypothetical protein
LTRYNYRCISRTGTKIGGYFFSDVSITTADDREEVMRFAMTEVAEQAYLTQNKVPWDPFNIQLIVKAQNEPEP